MIRCPFFLVDAFASEPLTGNPAGICLLDSPASSDWMQRVATEINQAETAFVWPLESGYSLKWFTPKAEVELCGHATLAAAAVLGGNLVFHTLSGELRTLCKGDLVSMDFPSEAPSLRDTPFAELDPIWEGANRLDWFLILESEQAVRDFEPDLCAIEKAGMRGLCVTGRTEGSEFDFVSRFFAPQYGIPEDPVTGSAHCGLAPLWAGRLGKTQFSAYQASKRGGWLSLTFEGDRIHLKGKAIKVVEGSLCA